MACFVKGVDTIFLLIGEFAHISAGLKGLLKIQI